MAMVIGDPIIEYLINNGLIPENCMHFIMEVKVGEPIKLHYSVWADGHEQSLEVLMGGVEMVVKQESEDHLR